MTNNEVRFTFQFVFSSIYMQMRMVRALGNGMVTVSYDFR